jgi:Lon protease-like protein
MLVPIAPAGASLLPLFPLPDVVLFPGVLLPLHIFEPRYRALVADALEADRRIGMVLLRGGWESDYEGKPPIHAIGSSGVIVHAARLDDGRYNIVLRGLERFRVVDEDHTRAYRRATIEPLPDRNDDSEQEALGELRVKLEARLRLSTETSGRENRASAIRVALMADEDFVHTLAQYLDLEPIEKQALLERDTLRLRAASLLELLEMKRLAAALPIVPNVSH